MTDFEIALMDLKRTVIRWCKNRTVQRWCAAIVLVLVAFYSLYSWMDGRTFQIHRNLPDTEIYDRPFGPVTFHVITYDEDQYGRDVFDLPASGIFSGNPIPFTLRFPHAIGVPVIKVQIDGSTYFLGIDTTQTENCILVDGNLSSRTWQFHSRYSLLTDPRSGGAMDFLSPNQSGDLRFPTSDDPTQPPVLAGLLGLSWLQTFDNVVIDYQNLELRFNEPAISGNAVPMEKSAIWEYLFVPFSADGRNETGIIDTASSSFVIRRDLGTFSWGIPSGKTT